MVNNFCNSNVDVLGLDFSDCPQDLVAMVSRKYGSGKMLSVHPIIVLPGDENCRTQQSQQAGSEIGRFGRVYSFLRDLTGGQLGSVCEGDYGSQLNDIGNAVTQAPQVFNLRCTPKDGDVDVAFSGTMTAPSTPVLNGSQLTFNPVLPDGTEFTASYKCY